MNVDDPQVKVLTRQLIWDMICHHDVYDGDIQQLFGMSPASEDVLNMEHAASDDRLNMVMDLLPRINELSAIAGAISTRSKLGILGLDEVDIAVALGTEIAVGSTVVIADLVSKGLISLNEGDRCV